MIRNRIDFESLELLLTTPKSLHLGAVCIASLVAVFHEGGNQTGIHHAIDRSHSRGQSRNDMHDFCPLIFEVLQFLQQGIWESRSAQIVF